MKIVLFGGKPVCLICRRKKAFFVDFFLLVLFDELNGFESKYLKHCIFRFFVLQKQLRQGQGSDIISV